MAIPDYESLMLPLLECLADGKTHVLAEVRERLAEVFCLTVEERKEKLPSGIQLRFDNRVGWARTFLKKAGLVQSPERGYVTITDAGRGILDKPPLKIDVAFLMKFDDFRKFRERPQDSQSPMSVKQRVEPLRNETPREQIEAGANTLRDELAEDLLLQLKALSPQFFEKAVVDVLLKMGYGGSRSEAGKVVGRSGDGGIDGIIKQDKLGLDLLYVQAKRWEGTVGRPVVQAFVGSLEGVRAQRGIIITTSQFSDEAVKYADSIAKKVVLIDGELLANLMIDHEVGVTLEQTYTIKRIDSDYFSEE